MIGTDNLDAKLLRLLGEKPLHPSEISRKLGVVRTTIQYRLGRLSKASLARKTIRGRKSIWQPVYKNIYNKNRYRVFIGKDIIHAYKQLFKLPHQTVILAIQGSEAAKSSLDNLPALFIKEAHKIFKKREIIMKGISNEKTLGHFNKLDKDMINSHIGRPQGLKMFSDNKFLTSGEVMSTEKFLLLSNPQSRFVLVIKDWGLTKIVNDTLELLFELLDGKNTFDLNSYLKKTKNRLVE